MEAREVPGLLRFCGRARHAWAPAAAAAAKRAAWRKGQKPPGRSKSAGRPERACQGWWRQSLPVVALGPRPLVAVAAPQAAKKCLPNGSVLSVDGCVRRAAGRTR